MKVLVAIYDRATQAHAPVMTVNTRAEAVRSLRQALKDPQSSIASSPSDYELWELGTYNEETGDITPNKELIARVEDHVGA